MSTLKESLQSKAMRVRILQMAMSGSTAHLACALSIIDIIVALYSRVLRLGNSITIPHSSESDYLIVSKGHGAMALYAVFEHFQWIEKRAIDNYFQDGSALHGLVEAKLPGFEVCSGSLGHGFPIAVGMAFGLKRRNSSRRVFCIVGDGEMNEGTIWESLLFASHHELSNLTMIVDANGFQAMGRVDEILQIEPLSEKIASFGWNVRECDGHSQSDFVSKLSFPSKPARPSAVIARTIKGKGVSFMESDNQWHYRRLTPELYQLAVSEVLNSREEADA